MEPTPATAGGGDETEALTWLRLERAPDKKLPPRNEQTELLRELALAVIGRAREAGASDIYAELQTGVARVSARADGRLVPFPAPITYLDVWCLALYLLHAAGTEYGLPLERDRVEGEADGARFAMSSTPGGTAFTVRLPAPAPDTLAALGLEPEQLALVERVLDSHAPGLIYVTAPTGAGKTATLQAMTAHRESTAPRPKVYECGNPIELRHPTRSQAVVSSERLLEMFFAAASEARADLVVAHDMRTLGDMKTAARAASAAQVMISFHAWEVEEAIARPHVLGLQPPEYVPHLRLVVNQRMVRTLCAECRAVDEEASTLARETRYTHAGCGRCGGTGYRGFHLLAEVLAPTDGMRRALCDRAALGDFPRAALEAVTSESRAGRMLTFADVVGRLFARGLTDLSEVNRHVRI